MAVDITNRESGAFWAELVKARPGERIIYHRGAVCAGVHRPDAMSASESKLVHLAQKKVRAFDYIYFAEKRGVVGGQKRGE